MIVQPMNARYHSMGPSFGKGNPLIQAIPVLPEGELLAEKLTRLPEGNFDSLQQRSRRERFMDVSTILDCHHPRLECALVSARQESMIYNAYRRRPPFAPQTLRRINAIDESSFTPASLAALPPSDVLMLLGASGIGKSTLEKSTLGLLPQVIYHEQYEERLFHQTQVVWLSVDAPALASPKGLFLAIAGALDEALKHTGQEPYTRTLSGSIATQQVLLTRALSSHFVGLIHVDDFQRLGEAGDTARDHAIATIIGMANIIGASLSISGTPAVKELLKDSFEASRRLTRRGSIDLLPPRTSADPYYRSFVRFLFRYQLQDQKVVLTDALIDGLWELTCGISAVLSSLYVATQELAIMAAVPMDLSLFQHTMASQFNLLQPAIRRMKNRIRKNLPIWNPADDAVVDKVLRKSSEERKGRGGQADV